ncbi:MAG: DUF364 domain-containing protein [Deltaproteobacteria bacterium]|nr:DUF364 domain-containing protein [Deltaproteobacteria bacterium]
MAGNKSWMVYDRLIESIPDDIVVEDCLIGLNWILVQSVGVGIAMTPPEGERTVPMAGSIRGMKVRRLAELSKSWRFMEAAIGLAAINSVCNARDTIEKRFGPAIWSASKINVFNLLLPEVAEKKVAVIGHFPGLQQLASKCRLSILERLPQAGDFPDSACEYLLPEQDVVLISGTTLVNKTLPRLLALSQNAYIAVVGPTTPLHPVLFECGVSLLAGTVVDDRESVWKQAAEGGTRSIFGRGARMVNIERKITAP